MTITLSYLIAGKERGQKFMPDVSLFLDDRLATNHDDFQDQFDYVAHDSFDSISVSKTEFK